MKIAFMFPGQGAQFAKMGEDFFYQYLEARNVYEKASEIVERDIAALCFKASPEELNNTINTQLAISTTSLAILAVLKKYGITADIEVGLSLGEYVALINSNILSFEDGLKLLERRSYFMATKVPAGNYSMIAVIGLSADKIEEICRGAQGFCVPANYNYSGQVVVTGEESAIENITKVLQQAGAKRVIKLNTSGPFHTKELYDASKCYKQELEKVTFHMQERKVIKNLDGSFYTKEDNIKEILEKHIISPVRFDKTIQTMQKEGVDTYIEVGPGKTLAGFVKKEIKEANVFSIQTIEDLNKLLDLKK
ncbi:MAG: ACP S-malonyltransferase [Clostridia bacterium]|jgi:[acyl-carrier-protein] S-malonyltransferase|nr:ACP S-malonyltransferase [Clostridia bacterium]